MTWFDLLVLSIMGLSIMSAALRGMVDEANTLISLGIAALCALLLAAPIVRLFGSTPSLETNIITVTGLFVGFFFLSTRLIKMTSSRLIARKPGRIDRVAGALFGFVRGWLVVGLGFLALDYYFDDKREPAAVKNSLTSGFAQKAGDILEDLGLETSVPEQDSSFLNETPNIENSNTENFA